MRTSVKPDDTCLNIVKNLLEGVDEKYSARYTLSDYWLGLPTDAGKSGAKKRRTSPRLLGHEERMVDD